MGVNYTKLCCSGGGIWLISQIGAIGVLEKLGIMSNIKRICW